MNDYGDVAAMSIAPSSAPHSRRMLLFRLPALLVILHAVLIVVTGLVWIHESHQMGSSLVGPAANSWYRITRTESFPASYLAQQAVEAALSRTPNGFGLSLSGAYAVAYWALLLVFGAVQWYLVGVLVLLARRRLHHSNSK